MFNLVTSFLKNVSTSSQPEPSLTLSNPRLERSIAYLKQAKNPKERTLALNAIYEILLESGYQWKGVNWAQFALMHSASITDNTEFSGGFSQISVEEWVYILKKWIDKEGLFLSHSLKESQLKNLCELLVDLKEYYSLLPLQLETNCDTALIEASATRLLERIESKIKKRGRTYIPAGYRKGVSNEGHAMPAKIFFDGNDVVIYSLNLGNGSESNAIVNIKPTHEVSSLRSFPIRIPKKVFFGPLGHTLFCHLIRYYTDPPRAYTHHYHGSNIIDLWLVVGTLQPHLGIDPQKLKGKAQRYGSCPEKAVKNIIHDELIENGFEHYMIRQVVINANLFSLIAGIHSFGHVRGRIQKALCEDAIHEFGVSVLKLEEQLTPEDLIVSYALVRGIYRTLKKTTLVTQTSGGILSKPLKRLQNLVNPSIATPANLLKLEFPEPTIFPNTLSTDLAPHHKVKTSFSRPTFNVKEPIENVKKWIQALEALSSGHKFNYFYDCIRTLPIPLWSEDKNWDSISESQARELVSLLETFLKKGIENTYSSTDQFTECFLGVYTIFAICDKLARKCPENKLEGFASPFVFFDFSFDPSEFVSLPIGEENFRYTQIYDYFDTSRKKCEHKVLFPVDKVLPVEQYVDEFMSSDYGKGAFYIKFLSLFFEDYFPKSLWISMKEMSFTLWEGKSKRLPPAVQTLYFLAYLSHTLFTSEKYARLKLPTTLSFKQTVDQGKKALLMVDGENKSEKRFNKDYKEHNACLELWGMSVGNHDHSLIPIFDFKHMTTNEAVCQRLTEARAKHYNITESVYRDLLRITRKKGLQLLQALQWLADESQARYIYLDLVNIQMIINHCFFAPREIAVRLKEEPHLIQPLRECIKNGLKFFKYNPSHISALLFLIRTGICFETYAKALNFPSGEKDEQLTSYIEHLEKLEKVFQKQIEEGKDRSYHRNGITKKERLDHIATLRLFAFSQKTVLSVEEHFELVGKLFFYTTNTSGECNWVSYKAYQFISDYMYMLNEAILSDQVKRNALCRHLILLHLEKSVEDLENSEWEGSFPVFRWKNFEINFYERKVFSQDEGHLVESACIVDFTKDIFPSYKQSKFWIGEGQISTLDGNLRIKDSYCERKIVFNGKECWYRACYFNHEEVDQLCLDFLNYSRYIQLTHFSSTTHEPSVVTYSTKIDKPFSCIFFKQSSISIHRLDEEGNLLPYVVVNLKETPKDSFISQRLCRLALPEEIICFVHEKTHEIYEIYYYKLGLHFEGTPNGLESREFTGYILQLDETLPELNHFPGAMVLRKEGMSKVILPALELTLDGKDFSQEISFKIEKNSFLDSTTHYFIYEIDPFDQTVSSKSMEANFYLVYLFKLQRNYKQAAAYIKRLKIDYNNAFIKAIYSKFFNIKDRAPGSIAFNVRLFLNYVYFFNQNVESKFTKNEEAQNWQRDSFYKEGLKWYENYLKSLHSHDLSSIPENVRLSTFEEKVLLKALKKWNKAFNDSTILKVRYTLLFSVDQKALIEIEPKKISLRPRPYSQIQPISKLTLSKIKKEIHPEIPLGPSLLSKAYKDEKVPYIPYSNRMTNFQLRRHFFEFYEEALKCKPFEPCAFDFTLLTILQVKDQNCSSPWINFENLQHILFYVRHFPHHFRGLHFNSCKTDEEKIDVFNAIIDKMDLVEEDSNYKKLLSYLQEEVTYKKSAPISLELPKTSSPNLSIAPSSHLPFKQKPLESFFTHLFTVNHTLIDVPSEPPFMNSSLVPEEGSLERKLLNKHVKKYEELKRQETPTYTLDPTHLGSVREGIRSFQRVLMEVELEPRKNKILKLANATYKLRGETLSKEELTEEIRFRLKKETKQIQEVTPEVVMKEVILKGNISFLAKNCPMLTSEEASSLIDSVKEYYHAQAIWMMCQDALDLIDQVAKKPENKILQRKLADLLSFDFYWDVKEYPEIDYMKIKRGMLPRPNQAKKYFQACQDIENHKCGLYQLAAGGGKSSYLLPLMALRARMKGMTPVMMTTPAMYSVEKDNMTHTFSMLEMSVEFLEVGLHMKFSSTMLQDIFEHLRINHLKGDVLLVTPQTYYALTLFEKYALLVEKDEEKVKWLGLIHHFFQNECLLIADELHKTLDALTKAILGIGNYQNLPEHEKKLFLRLLKPLLGLKTVVCEKNRSIAEVGRLQNNVLGGPTLSELKEVQLALAKDLALSKRLNANSSEQTELIHYWTSEESDIPSFLIDWHTKDHKRAELVTLAGYFILYLLPQIVKMRTGMDHDKSLYQEEYFDTPVQNKVPSTAHFKDKYKALATSIKGTFHRGIAPFQLSALLIKMIIKDRNTPNSLKTPSPEAQLFMSWLKGSSLDGLHLRDVSLSDKEQQETLSSILSYHPAAIKYMLLNVILPQIGLSAEELECTPVHLLNGFKHAIVTSATPLHPLCYPRRIETHHYDDLYETHMLTHYCHPKNEGKLFPEDANTFFDFMRQNYPQELTEALYYVDVGGFFVDFENEKIAEKWLEAAQLDGVLFFHESRSFEVSRNERIILLLPKSKENPKGKKIECEGSQIELTLKKENLDWSTLRIGAFLDAAHTESADIPQRENALVLLFEGDNVSTLRKEQGLARDRGFLDPIQDHRTITVVQKSLAEKIPKVNTLSQQNQPSILNNADLIQHNNKNETLETSKRIIMNAFQEIAYEIENIADTELRRHQSNPQVKIFMAQKYIKGLLQSNAQDAFWGFLRHNSDQDTEVVLLNFAKEVYNRFGFTILFEKNVDLQDKVKGIIDKVKKKVPKISSNFNQTISTQIEQRCHLNKDTDQIQIKPRPRDPVSSEGDYGSVSIMEPFFFEKTWKYQCNDLFNTKGFNKDLYLERNQIHTAKNEGVSMMEKYLKPIDFFIIVVFKNGDKKALVVSNEILQTDLDVLVTKEGKGKLEHGVFIVTATGILCQKGKGAIAVEEEKIQEILHSEWLKDLTIDAALLNGQVLHEERLKERIKQWPDFSDLWLRITNALPNPEVANHGAITKILTSLELGK